MPAPLWPSNAKICPSYIVRSTPSTAFLIPSGVSNSFRRPRTVTQRPAAAKHTGKLSQESSRAATTQPVYPLRAGVEPHQLLPRCHHGRQPHLPAPEAVFSHCHRCSGPICCFDSRNSNAGSRRSTTALGHRIRRELLHRQREKQETCVNNSFRELTKDLKSESVIPLSRYHPRKV